MYYYSPLDATFQAIPSYSKIYYLQRPGPKNEKLVTFPPGFKMVAGNPFRKTYDHKSFADQAINFVCQDYACATLTDIHACEWAADIPLRIGAEAGTRATPSGRTGPPSSTTTAQTACEHRSCSRLAGMVLTFSRATART